MRCKKHKIRFFRVLKHQLEKSDREKSRNWTSVYFLLISPFLARISDYQNAKEAKIEKAAKPSKSLLLLYCLIFNNGFLLRFDRLSLRQPWKNLLIQLV